MPHHVKIVPVRLRSHDPGLGCDRLRVIGYRAVCECGERTAVAESVAAARLAIREHAQTPPFSVSQ
jgi:hypothetical protein